MIGRKIDFCILHFHEEREQVWYEMFFEDPFYLVIPKDRKSGLNLPEKRKLTKEDLASLSSEPFVMVSARQKLRLVAAETGISFLPGSYLNLYSGVERLVCYPLDRSLEGAWKLAIACPKKGKLPKSSREFLKFLTETLNSMHVKGGLCDERFHGS